MILDPCCEPGAIMRLAHLEGYSGDRYTIVRIKRIYLRYYLLAHSEYAQVIYEVSWDRKKLTSLSGITVTHDFMLLAIRDGCL